MLAGTLIFADSLGKVQMFLGVVRIAGDGCPSPSGMWKEGDTMLNLAKRRYLIFAYGRISLIRILDVQHPNMTEGFPFDLTCKSVLPLFPSLSD